MRSDLGAHQIAFYCGIWHSPYRLVAAIVDGGGTLVARHTTDRTPSDFWNLLVDIENHHGLDGCFLVTDELLQSSMAFANIAVQRGCQVLTVPRVLVCDMQVLASSSPHVTPKQLALVMARLPLCHAVSHRLAPLPPLVDNDVL